MQGVICREWLVLFKDYNAADGCFSARPAGVPQIPQSCVAVLDNAGVPDHPNIPCELRLVVTYLANSDIYILYETVH